MNVENAVCIKDRTSHVVELENNETSSGKLPYKLVSRSNWWALLEVTVR